MVEFEDYFKRRLLSVAVMKHVTMFKVIDLKGKKQSPGSVL